MNTPAHSYFPAVILFLVGMGSTPRAWARVEINVTHVGFMTVREGSVARAGAWTPIVVDLDLAEQASFDGTLRAAQFDGDGDQCFDSVDVHLSADTGGARRFLYVLTRPVNGEARFGVELLGGEGGAVEFVSQGELTVRGEPAQRPTLIPDDERLVLSISTGAIGPIRMLAEAKETELFERPVHVAHIGPAELPDLWVGLEMVDVIVWDDAKPEEFTLRQREALIEWVRYGGTLFISAGRSAGSVQQSEDIAKVLPVELGPTVVATNLPQTRRRLLGEPSRGPDLPANASPGVKEDWYLDPLPSPIVVSQCTLRSGAEVVASESMAAVAANLGSAAADGGDFPIVVRRRLDRGQVIFSAVSLSDLLSGTGEAPDLFARLFYLVRRKQADEMVPHPVSLFGHVVSAVGFATSGSAYLLMASMFSIIYLAVATGGTWWFLGKRGWRRHSWTAFALVSGVASVMSIVAVGWAKGLGERVHQLSVIDLEAGERYGTGTVFFGLKTGTDRELDVWLPPDPVSAREPAATSCFLRPLPTGSDAMESQLSFADPGAYRLVPASAVIEGVRLRSTLKRFEGRWQGPVSGTVTGQLSFTGRTFTEDSFLVNGLGVDLNDCYLLYAELDLTDRTGKPSVSPRDEAINAYFLGRLVKGATVDLAPVLYPERLKENQPNPAGRPTLKTRQRTWSEPLSRTFDLGLVSGPEAVMVTGEERNALLLASTVGEFDPTTMQGVASQMFGRNTWSRDRLRQLDMRSQMRPNCAILIGFANNPGPIRLFRRAGEGGYGPIEPDQGKSSTMYRVRIPVTLIERKSIEDETE